MPSKRPRRTKVEKAQLSRLITIRYFTRGMVQREIVEDLKKIGVQTSLTRVNHYIKVATDRQLKNESEDIKAARNQVLSEIRILKTESWEAWERSKQNAESITRKKIIPPGQMPAQDEGEESSMGSSESQSSIEETKNVRGQVGDPRFLERYQCLCEQECKILGINAPDKLKLSGDLEIGASVELSKLTREQLTALRCVLHGGTGDDQ